MAKQTIDYLKPPADIKPEAMKGYTLVTDLNKGAVVIQGRIFYLIETVNKTTHRYLGYFVYYPCLFKGKYEIEFAPFHKMNGKRWSVYASSDHDREEWKRMILECVKDGIAKKRLYIKQEDPLIKVYKTS